MSDKLFISTIITSLVALAGMVLMIILYRQQKHG